MRTVLLAMLLLAVLPPPVAAQDRDTLDAAESLRARDRVVRLTPINVTATRTAMNVFDTPAAVTVLDSADIRERAPDTVTDLFRELPGLDVNGVGPNQTRPTIRGQRGQRILLLEDGLRLNNTRRQQDFGEIVGLVDVGVLDRVEVVRGPSSVLYGSDAIGGVVNLMTREPRVEDGLGGSVRYRYSTHDDQSKVEATLSGRSGRWGALGSATYRDADTYEAPGGSFGEITLADDTRVLDTGVQDESLYLKLGYDLGEGQRAFGTFERYRADGAGLGFVDPAAYAPDEPFIQILFPFQTFAKYALGYQASGWTVPVAEELEARAYFQDNERQLDLNVRLPIGPPGGLLDVHSENTTDLETVGLRVEAKVRPVARHRLTYGLDFFRDAAGNRDFSRTTITGLGPPMTVESNAPLVPDASLRNWGLFLQDEIGIGPRGTVILGARYQDIHVESEATEGSDRDPVSDDDRTVVAAANGLLEITPQVVLVAAVGRGFRAPNLVERFFEGPVAEVGSFQSPNPELGPETSLDVELGARFRGRRLYAEAFAFRNQIRDGIRIAPTGEVVNGLPEFRNVNVDELLFRGVELSGEMLFESGITLGGNVTVLDSEDVNDPETSVGESFDSKLVAEAGYRDPAGRFWVEYALRHNGEREDVVLETNPIGESLPAFTVHAVRGGAKVFETAAFTQRVGFAVENLADELYAESANAAFFRPAAGRRLIVTWDASF